MSLKLKLVSLFIAVAIIPLSLTGLFSFQQAKQKLIQETSDTLVAVADVQTKRINEIVDKKIEIVKLIGSRPEIRTGLKVYQETGSTGELAAIQRAIQEAKDSLITIKRVTIIDQHETIVASTDETLAGQPIRSRWREEHPAEARSYHLHEIFKDDSNLLRVRVHGPIIVGGEQLGLLEVEVDADPFVAVTEDYAGLGKTGEVLLAKKNQTGDALFITPLRFDAGAALIRAIPKEKTNIPVTHALLGEEKTFLEKDFVDYRDTPVFAVTRFIDSLGWGLVVKIDQTEALAPAKALLTTFLLIISTTALTAVLLAYVLARAIARPIIDLTAVTSRLAALDFSTTTTTTTDSNDEVGQLARAFNQMAGKLRESYSTLEEKVKEKTAVLSEAQAIAHVGNWEWNIPKNIVTWSDELFRIFGLAPQSVPLSYDSYLRLVYPEDQEIASKTVKAALKNHESFEFDHRTKLADGRIRWILGRGRVVLDSQGAPMAMVGTAQDITKEKEIDKAKTEFVSLASHQLRTPLSTINWYSEMLLAGDAGALSVEQKKYVDEIYGGNQRMVALVNALLNVSRIDLGTFSVELEPTNVAELAHNVVKELQPDILTKNLGVEEQYADGLPVMNVDPKLMRIILQNLLSNAVKYTPEAGSITLTVSKVKDQLSIVVKDTGYGIPAAQQAKIFTKLFRADNVREKDTSGTGLGLYLVKSVVEHSGGQVWFESEEGKGTTFYVTLPLSGMKAKPGTRRLDIAKGSS